MIPCPDPTICGVSNHRSASNCIASRYPSKSGNKSSRSINEVTSSVSVRQDLASSDTIKESLEDCIESSFILSGESGEVRYLPRDDDPSFEPEDGATKFCTRKQIAIHALGGLLDDVAQLEKERPDLSPEERLDILRDRPVYAKYQRTGHNQIVDMQRRIDGTWDHNQHYDINDLRSSFKIDGGHTFVGAYVVCYREARANILEDYGDDLVDPKGMSDFKTARKSNLEDLERLHRERSQNQSEYDDFNEMMSRDVKIGRSINEKLRSYFNDPTAQ